MISDLVKEATSGFGVRPGFDGLSDFFFKKAIEKNLLLYAHDRHGILAEKQDYIEFLNELEKEGVNPAVKNLNKKGLPYWIVYKTEKTCISIQYDTKSRDIACQMYSFDSAEISKFTKFFAKKINSRPNLSGNVYMITKRMDGSFDLSQMGRLTTQYVSDNYTAKINESFDFIKKQLTSKTPVGRLILMHGKPGTGKSYFIRSLIAQSDVESILIPTHLVGHLTGPDLISCICDCRGETEKLKPTLLIIEDADTALIKRDSMRSNLSTLSDILNMSDGLLGDFADLRVLCTTNTEKIELDPAVIRPGRLCANVEFDLLPKEDCARIYKRLTGNEKDFTRNHSLADIYAMSNGVEPESLDFTIKPLGGNFI